MVSERDRNLSKPFLTFGNVYFRRDSISAFHHMKKPSSGTTGNLTSIEGSHVHYSLLANLLRRSGVPVIATVQSLFKPRKPANPGDENANVNQHENWQTFTGPSWREQLSRSFMFSKVCDSGVFRVCSKDGSVPVTKWRMKVSMCEVEDN